MKKAILMILGISFIFAGIGCGKNEPSKKAEKKPDQIERVGNAASTLGYNGEKIKKDLSGLQDLKETQDKEMEETLDR